MIEKPNLSDVTVCAVDTRQPELAARALKLSSAKCTFGEAILFTNRSVKTNARIVKIPVINSHLAYGAFLLKKLCTHIRTPWVLVVQWDGYVVDASAWSTEFFDFDYIGARWPGRDDDEAVGNGGFSLRSMKLLRLVATDEFPIRSDRPEDALLSFYRPLLQAKHGIRFAPVDIADRFSYEAHSPDSPTFGFHGMFNLHHHVNDEALDRLIDSLSTDVAASTPAIALLANLCGDSRFANASTLYRRLRAKRSAAEIEQELTRLNVTPLQASALVAQREKWFRLIR